MRIEKWHFSSRGENHHFSVVRNDKDFLIIPGRKVPLFYPHLRLQNLRFFIQQSFNFISPANLFFKNVTQISGSAKQIHDPEIHHFAKFIMMNSAKKQHSNAKFFLKIFYFFIFNTFLADNLTF